jgi:serine/threonine protein kinase
MTVAKKPRIGFNLQVLLRVLLLLAVAALVGWNIGGTISVALVVLLPLTYYLARRSAAKTIRKISEDAEKLRQELAEAKKELHHAAERARLLELVCRSFGVPSAETVSRDDRVQTPTDSKVRPSPPLPKHLGQYQLLEKLGEGGMGAVYRALHMRLKRPVALKVLPAQLLHDERAVARFRREMEAVGKLDHPNIVRASDAGEDAGWHFLVMELVEGVDLAQLSALLGPFPVADACEVARQAASALQYAHEHGLVHRDIKPSNLLMTPAGDVKLLDLGLARLYGEQAVSEVLTATGAVMGTPDYMAPEQSFEPKAVDIRADLYGLGCTLYKLLTGRPPFDGPEYGTLAQKLLAHAQAPVPPIRVRRPEVPEALSAVLDRLLAKRPADRFGTPMEAEATLVSFASGQKLSELYAAAQHRLVLNAAPTGEYLPGESG